jgi:hypothetical protein
MIRPTESEAPSYFHSYIAEVVGEDVLATLRAQMDDLTALLASMDDAQARYRYADGKWSIKEVVGHIMDGERLFGMRAVCIARGDQQSLPGFDENAYVDIALFDERSLASMLSEFVHLRNANIIAFENMDEDAAGRIGTANGRQVSARALVWITAGHVEHHIRILRERYLNP